MGQVENGLERDMEEVREMVWVWVCEREAGIGGLVLSLTLFLLWSCLCVLFFFFIYFFIYFFTHKLIIMHFMLPSQDFFASTTHNPSPSPSLPLSYITHTCS